MIDRSCYRLAGNQSNFLKMVSRWHYRQVSRLTASPSLVEESFYMTMFEIVVNNIVANGPS